MSVLSLHEKLITRDTQLHFSQLSAIQHNLLALNQKTRLTPTRFMSLICPKGIQHDSDFLLLSLGFLLENTHDLLLVFEYTCAYTDHFIAIRSV